MVLCARTQSCIQPNCNRARKYRWVTDRLRAPTEHGREGENTLEGSFGVSWKKNTMIRECYIWNWAFVVCVWSRYNLRSGFLGRKISSLKIKYWEAIYVNVKFPLLMKSDTYFPNNCFLSIFFQLYLNLIGNALSFHFDSVKFCFICEKVTFP